jgi:hypothetical protein
MRAELLAASGVLELPNGKLRVQKRFFVPSAYGEDLVVGLAFILGPALQTLRHNLETPTHRYIQRVAYSDYLASSDVDTFRRISHEQAEQLMNNIDAWITQNESRGTGPDDLNRRTGLGVFYFEDNSKT